MPLRWKSQIQSWENFRHKLDSIYW